MERIEQMFKKEFNIEVTKNIEQVIQKIIFNAVNDLIFVMKVEENKAFRYVAANEAGANHVPGCIGHYLHELFEDFDPLHLQKKYEHVARTKKVYSFKVSSYLPNGKLYYGESILTPILGANNQCLYIVSVTRDVSVSMEEKKKLKLSEQQYRSLFDHNLDPIFSLDAKGNFLSANPSTYKVTGYTEKELLNRSILYLIHEDDQPKFREMFVKTLDGSVDETLTCRLVHKRAKQIRIHFKTVPIVVNDNITGVYVIARDITKQYQHEKMIKHMAYHDDLTGLLNRSALKERLRKAVNEAKQQNTVLAVMYVDLDRFKFLNDTMGHNIGDLLLKKVSDRFTKIVSNGNTVFRQGGDEFIFLLKNTSRDEAKEYAQAILRAFYSPFVLRSQEVFITPSIGISMYPTDGEDEESLIKNADTALYRVKERGKSHFQFYTEDMKKGTPRALQLEMGLRKAIEKNELVMYYQPQFDIKTSQVNSFEAFIRWNSPTLGFVSPGEFIPLAEETGMIISIGKWVVKTVCEQLKSWQEKGYQQTTIAINLSTRQFSQPDIVQTFKNSIVNSGISPNQIEIEVTEGALQDAKEAVFILNQLKDLGTSISIDDFGTGYSSLSHLKRFPIDTLKIDQSFVRDVHVDEDNKSIVTIIIQMAKSLGLSVVAEGVELIEQVELLKALDCQKVQGYFYSRPLPTEEIELRYLTKK